MLTTHRVRSKPLTLLAIVLASCVSTAALAQGHTSKQFKGAKANTGTVTHAVKDGKDTLTLSDDFKTPETPAPHWQIVDSKGNTYLLQRMMVKGGNGDVLTRTIIVPAYIPDIAKVQIWCAFAETLLGETTFDTVIKCQGTRMHSMADTHTTSMFTGVKANAGTCTHTTMNGQSTLSLSDDFKVPDAPAPHWQVVDSQGNTYLLQRLVIKGDKLNKTITVPSYVHDVAKVQIWCAYAQVLLGEATFETPVH